MLVTFALAAYLSAYCVTQRNKRLKGMQIATHRLRHVWHACAATVAVPRLYWRRLDPPEFVGCMINEGVTVIDSAESFREQYRYRFSASAV